MLKNLLKSISSSLRLLSYKFIYYLSALYQYYRVYWFGYTTPKTRLECHPGSSFSSNKKERSDRLALFVAYHPGKCVPFSNFNYLRALRLAGFEILYIHNGSLPREVVASLSGLCAKVFCRINSGQDFGAWKDAYLHASQEGLLDNVDWLLMCNDSNHFLGGENGDDFVMKFRKELERSPVELIALNKNYELWMHYQSFFLCFRRSIFTSLSFEKFWRKYRALSHRYHAINNGEIALTQNVLKRASAKVLYESTGLYWALHSESFNIDEFISYLPQNAMYLCESISNCGSGISTVALQRVMALLDFHNPSHAYALIFVRYLSSPFLKKDLLRQGAYSLPQIAALLQSIILKSNPLLCSEIICDYQNGGRHTSYIRYPREAFRKGINAIQGVAFRGYGDALTSLGIKLYDPKNY